MKDDEAHAFEASPLFDTILAMRRWDEAAKVCVLSLLLLYLSLLLLLSLRGRCLHAEPVPAHSALPRSCVACVACVACACVLMQVKDMPDVPPLESYRAMLASLILPAPSS